MPFWVSDADDPRGHANDDRVGVADCVADYLAGDGRADAAVDAG